MSKGPAAGKRATPSKRASATKRPATKAAAKRPAAKPAAKATMPAAKATKRPATKAPSKPAARTAKPAAKRTTAAKAAKATMPAAKATKRTTAAKPAKPAAKRSTAGKAAKPATKATKATKASTNAKRTTATKAAKPAAKAAKRPAAKSAADERRAKSRRKVVPRRAVAERRASEAGRTAPTRRTRSERRVPRERRLGAAAKGHDESALQTRLVEAARAAGAPADVLTRQRKEDPFAVLEWLVPRRGGMAAGTVRSVTDAAEALLRHRIFVHPGAGGARVVPVVFGTGGHRGVIGSGLTLLHVHVIVTALLRAIAAMPPAQRGEVFGAAELGAVQRRGFVLGHDNRLFNPEFSYYAASLLHEAGYAVRYAGRISSPELSLLVPLRGWAGSLNFTPSHNPFRWGGMKFAPADGGLAGGDLTDPLAAEANRLLAATAPADWPAPAALEARIAAESRRIERVDLHDAYLDALNEHPVVRLAELIEEIRALPAGQRLAYVADPTWGAAVPVYERLQQRLGADVLQVIHTEVDPYFGGQVTEPNEHTLADALALLKRTPGAHKVMIRNDPDSDRGLVGDEAGAIQMNRFAPLVFRYLRDLGLSGDLVTTLPTSQLGPDYARRHGSTVLLTPTGFKNFRPHLKGGRALLAYEESNGLTIRGHTLDKDGVLVGLLGARIVLHYGRPLSALMAELEAELGHYHYRQETFMIDMSAAEAHERLKALGATRPGETFRAGGHDYTILEINAEDGYRFALDGGSWVMMRPSGTEPKVRVYAESRESPQVTEALCAAAKERALAAVHAR